MVSVIIMLTTIITLFFFPPSAYDSFIQNIEVAKNFVGIFHVMEKPDQTFWGKCFYTSYTLLILCNSKNT